MAEAQLLAYRLEEAVHQLNRYGGVPDERVVTLIETLADLNDDLMHMRDLGGVKQRLMAGINAI